MARPRSIPDDDIFAAIRTALARDGEKAVAFGPVAQMTGLAAPSLVQRYGSRDGMVRAALLDGWQKLAARTELVDDPHPHGLLKALTEPATLMTDPALMAVTLRDPALALYSVALIDIWKGVGLATLIYIAGLASISPEYYEAARIDGATRRQMFWRVTVPLVRPATVTVITLSLIGGLRSFDLIWAMTGGGPGFSSDVLASVIYKQYQAGFYGLSTAGNVILFLLIAALILPLTLWFNRREVTQ